MKHISKNSSDNGDSSVPTDLLQNMKEEIATWTGINEDVPKYVKLHDLMEELKKNKDIKGIQKCVVEQVMPVLIKKTDQTL